MSKWDNYEQWGALGQWQYDQSRDVLINLAAQDGFSGYVNKRFLSWDDYAVEGTVFYEGSSTGAIGFAFRWQNENNFYFFLMGAGGMQLGKVVEGSLTYLSEPRQPVFCQPERQYAVRVAVTENRIRVWVDGVLQYDCEDSNLGNGAFSPLTVSQANACFTDFKAYLLPLQAFRPGIGDVDDCRVMPPREGYEPVDFKYGVRITWSRDQTIIIYPAVHFSYMIWAEGNRAGARWVSSPYVGYASVNGRPPLAKDNDGLAPAYAQVPLFDIPGNVTDVEYRIGNISNLNVNATFLGAGGDRTIDSNDIIKFESSLTQEQTLTVPYYSEETVYVGRVAPGNLYVSSPLPVPQGAQLVVRPLMPGVSVWVEGNVVYARLTASSVFGSWHPYIHSGYYAFGEKLHYLYAQKVTETVQVQNGQGTIAYPQQGAPVIVTDARGRELRCVAFRDDVGEITLYNTEKFEGLGTDIIYLMYDGLEDVQVTVNGLPAAFSLNGNVLTLSSHLRPEDKLVVRYKLSNSYCMKPYVAFAREQNRIVSIPPDYSISRVNRYNVFDLAYITPKFL